MKVAGEGGRNGAQVRSAQGGPGPARGWAGRGRRGRPEKRAGGGPAPPLSTLPGHAGTWPGGTALLRQLQQVLVGGQRRFGAFANRDQDLLGDHVGDVAG